MSKLTDKIEALAWYTTAQMRVQDILADVRALEATTDDDRIARLLREAYEDGKVEAYEHAMNVIDNPLGVAGARIAFARAIDALKGKGDDNE